MNLSLQSCTIFALLSPPHLTTVSPAYLSQDKTSRMSCLIFSYLEKPCPLSVGSFICMAYLSCTFYNCQKTNTARPA